jgi:hypothetical protein
MPKWENSLFSRVKTEKEKGRKEHRRMNWKYIGRGVGACIRVLGTLCEDSSQLTPSDELTVHLLHVSDELPEEKWRRRRRFIRWFTGARLRGTISTASSTGWTDGPSNGSSDDHVFANRKVLASKFSAPDEPTHRRMKHQMNCVSGFATTTWRGGAPDEPTPMKRGASIHLMVHVSAAFSQRLLDALDYLYPLHSQIWGCWIVWKCRGVQDT